MAGEVHIGNVGEIFRATVEERDATDTLVAVDVSTATLKQITFRKPNGTLVVQTATFTTDGTDGKIQYVTVAGDLDVPGLWRAQTYVELPSGKFYADDVTFTVRSNLS